MEHEKKMRGPVYLSDHSADAKEMGSGMVLLSSPALMGATSSAQVILVIVSGIIISFLLERYLAKRFEASIFDRFVLFGLGLVLGLLSLNFFSKLVWRILRYFETTLITPGNAAILGQSIVIALFLFAQLYLSAKVRATNAAFMRGAVISQVIIITHRPRLGLSYIAILVLLALSLGFSVYHHFKGASAEED